VQNVNISRQENHFHSGIFQAIGFKEFAAYLRLSGEERRGQNGREKLSEGVEMLKLVSE